MEPGTAGRRMISQEYRGVGDKWIQTYKYYLIWRLALCRPLILHTGTGGYDYEMWRTDLP